MKAGIIGLESFRDSALVWLFFLPFVLWPLVPLAPLCSVAMIAGCCGVEFAMRQGGTSFSLVDIYWRLSNERTGRRSDGPIGLPSALRERICEGERVGVGVSRLRRGRGRGLQKTKGSEHLADKLREVSAREDGVRVAQLEESARHSGVQEDLVDSAEKSEGIRALPRPLRRRNAREGWLSDPQIRP